MNRRHYWAVLCVVAWLAYFAVATWIPVSPGGPGGLALIGSLVIGIVLLSSLLLAGELPRWPVGVRVIMFVSGLILALVPFIRQFTLDLALLLPLMLGALALEGVACLWLKWPGWRVNTRLASFAVLAIATMAPFVVPERTHLSRALGAVGLMLIALPVGYWIGDKMEKATHLVPLSIAMAMADIFSVYQGPTRHVVGELEKHEQEAEQLAQGISAASSEHARLLAEQAYLSLKAPLAEFVIVHLPVAGLGETVPVLGIGDFVVLAFLFRAAWVHNINPLKVFFSAVFSVLAAVGLAMTINQPLPALPFIAFGTTGYLLLTEPRLRRLDRQEIALSVIVAALFLALIIWKWLF